MNGLKAVNVIFLWEVHVSNHGHLIIMLVTCHAHMRHWAFMNCIQYLTLHLLIVVFLLFFALRSRNLKSHTLINTKIAITDKQ